MKSLFACLLLLGSSALLGAGTWNSEKGILAQTSRNTKTAEKNIPFAATGSWRCIIEPGPYDGGISLAADGLKFELLDKKGGTLLVFKADGEKLWMDAGIGWVPYEPLWLEVLQEAQRIRVQMLLADGKKLLSMSPWLPYTERKNTASLSFATTENTARFALWSRVSTPFMPYTPNNPSALRLPQAGDNSWRVVGGGAWCWHTTKKQEVQQSRKIERTTLINTSEQTATGTRRCRLRLNKGTCGGGMLVHTDPTAQSGYLLWCGGKYGNGALMLYRLPLKHLWSSPQGQWNWDKDYVLQADFANGSIRAHLLDNNGRTIATSKAVKLLPKERERKGMTGYQTWRGTGSFWPTAAIAENNVPETPVAKQRLSDWEMLAGKWKLDKSELHCLERKGKATAICTAIKGARGVFQCQVHSGGATSISLLFQHDSKAGFECRLDVRGATLADSRGNVLWSDGKIRLQKNKTYRLEGIVETDRVMIRIRDDRGKLLVESVERYVSDSNNDRLGNLGVSCTGGTATFSNWKWTAQK